ncbi:unnamed protein product [Caenorhabditis angaria]|uniref:eIF-4F 25 kDa subunit n=1 Tax=Caenorhabditis angaria TaxID=860376 RepID=A0A9P1N8T1_9PELO|nr:unnamed protein product [Caenorhabditis angaria]
MQSGCDLRMSQMMAMYEPELHPLKNEWALWHLEKEESKEWVDCLKVIREIETSEDYWLMFHNVASPGNLKNGSDYCFFKKGVIPMWEDKHNKFGGRWLIEIGEKKTPQETTQHINFHWYKMLFAMVTDKFGEYGKNICGAVVNIRQENNKISLWTCDGKNDDANLKIGGILKTELSIPDSAIMKYQLHENFLIGIKYYARPRLFIPPRERFSYSASQCFSPKL